MKIYRKKQFIRIKNDLFDIDDIKSIIVCKSEILEEPKWKIVVEREEGYTESYNYPTAEDADIELKKIRQQLIKAGCYLGD